MADDKAQAFFILHDDDAVNKRVCEALGMVFHSDNPNAHHNIDALGQRLATSYALQNHMANFMRYQIEEMIKNEICNNLRMETFLDPRRHDLHIRLSYKGNGVTQQTINLRGY